jgi:hypothetical protein
MEEQCTLSWDALVDLFVSELDSLNAFRLERVKDLLAIARSMHDFNEKMKDDMVEVLVENNWRKGEVVKSLSEAQAALLRAVNGLSGKRGVKEIEELNELLPVDTYGLPGNSEREQEGSEGVLRGPLRSVDSKEVRGGCKGLQGWR